MVKGEKVTSLERGIKMERGLRPLSRHIRLLETTGEEKYQNPSLISLHERETPIPQRE
jgi:hypothetical protein